MNEQIYQVLEFKKIYKDRIKPDDKDVFYAIESSFYTCNAEVAAAELRQGNRRIFTFPELKEITSFDIKHKTK